MHLFTARFQRIPILMGRTLIVAHAWTDHSSTAVGTLLIILLRRSNHSLHRAPPSSPLRPLPVPPPAAIHELGETYGQCNTLGYVPILFR